MRLTVLGASGHTGRHLVEQALGAGHAVTAVVRNPARLPIRHQRLKLVVADVLDPAAIQPAAAGADAVVSVLGPRSYRTASSTISAGTASSAPGGAGQAGGSYAQPWVASCFSRSFSRSR